MVQLYFSADDFGLTDGIARGIVSSIRDGVSAATTSAMVCVPDAATLAALVRSVAGASRHLQLTGGRPCLPRRVCRRWWASGAFLPSRAAVTAAAPQRGSHAEWNAQLARLARYWDRGDAPGQPSPRPPPARRLRRLLRHRPEARPATLRSHDRRMTRRCAATSAAPTNVDRVLRSQGHGRGSAPRADALRDPAQRAGRRARSHVSPRRGRRRAAGR
ncbi:MAG: ChbG/HpnK family deacetylase [Caldilineaceae bacterium]